jgi:hypothetical protein
MLAFTAVITISVLGYQKSLLIAAATTIAERSALADVNEDDEDNLIAGVLDRLGLQGAAASLSTESGVEVARVSLLALGSFELQEVGFAVIEQ